MCSILYFLLLLVQCSATPSLTPTGSLIMSLQVPYTNGIVLERVTLLNLLTRERVVVFPVERCLLTSRGSCAFPAVTSPSRVVTIVPPSWLCSRAAREAGGLQGAVEMEFPTQGVQRVDWVFRAADTTICGKVDLSRPEWAASSSIKVLLLIVCLPLALTYVLVMICKLKLVGQQTDNEAGPPQESIPAELARWHQRAQQRARAFSPWVDTPTHIEM